MFFHTLDRIGERLKMHMLMTLLHIRLVYFHTVIKLAIYGKKGRECLCMNTQQKDGGRNGTNY